MKTKTTTKTKLKSKFLFKPLSKSKFLKPTKPKMNYTLERFGKQIYLAEIGQSMNIRFAICRPEGDKLIQLTPTVKCRDFLCDVYSSTLQKTDFSIYGMSWKGTTDSPPWDGVYLLVQCPDKKAMDNFDKNISKLWAIEDKNGYTRSQVQTVSELERIVVGQKDWINSVLSFSLYTLLLRIFGYTLKADNEDWIKDFAGQGASDSKYIANFPRESLDKVLNDLSLLKMEEWNGLSYKEHGTGGVHHHSGIVSLFSFHSECNQGTVRKNKHWQEFQKLGFKTYTKP